MQFVGLFARFLGWTVGVVLGLVVLFYLILVAINWRDERPSATALRFQNYHLELPPVADEDNAFVFGLGFEAPVDQDPIRVGFERKQWLERALAADDFDNHKDPLPEPFDFRAARPPKVAEVVENCAPGGTDCDAALSGVGTDAQSWIDSQAWRLDRYRAALKYDAWVEIHPFHERFPTMLSALSDAQWLLLFQARSLAMQGRVAAAKALLEEDMVFWRMVLASADILVTKMIATNALRKHFKVGNWIAQSLPPKEVGNLIPESWRSEISDEERSMLRCLVGEWRYSTALLRRLKATNSATWSLEVDGEQTAANRVAAVLSQPFWKELATSNRTAEFHADTVIALDVPYERFDEAIAAVAGAHSAMSNDMLSLLSVYDPIGRITHAIAAPTFVSYFRRVADLEGQRRAALLAAQLRQQQVSAAEVLQSLRNSSLRHPYTEEPFDWDANSRSLVFKGLEESHRGTHTYPVK